ncbi:hypothetical protein D9615_002132 [Tricholomella constricta]|uniref:Uncharacterized protein n=1 Tax=Tricholomella constricta TaxID=117010 RepID=A0A8H5HNZ4_9AGAR|nr:hypothetical protein D9615_002132 [Tricholomella constricta]
MDVVDHHNEQSYFPIHPNIQPVRTGDSLHSLTTSSGDSLPRRARHRPPTPPFPSTTPLPSTTNGHYPPNRTAGMGNPLKGKAKERPDPAYANFLSRVRDEERQEQLPRGRSRSNSSGASMHAILRLLAHETARADAAERELAKDNEAVIARVRNMKEAHLRAEAELSRVTSELALYKLQLDLAQREILRAQKILDDVEHARVEAEERGIKDRERARKLVLQRAIEVAREEGRREGWRQSLERGQWHTWEMQRDDEVNDEDFEEEPMREQSPPGRSRSKRSMTLTSIRPAIEHLRGKSRSGAASRKRDSPDIPRNVPPLPIASPIPLRAPPTQQGELGKESSHLSNPISVPRDAYRRPHSRIQSPPHPPRSETCSPSLAPSLRSRRSHHSIPPDGYIPTLDSDAHIALPPPHELSSPVEFSASRDGGMEARGVTLNVDELRNGKGKGVDRTERGEGRNDDPTVPAVHVYGSVFRARSDPASESGGVFRVLKNDGRDTPALSTVSRVSTRISQYDIIGPPKAYKERDSGDQYSGGENSLRQVMNTREREDVREGAPRKLTQPEKIVEDWRSANWSRVGTPPVRSGDKRAASTTRGSSHSENTQIRDINSAIQNSSRALSPRVSEGSRPLPDNSQVIPTSNPEPGERGSYIYLSANSDHYSTRPATQPPRRPSVANIYRQPTPSSGPNRSPPTSQPRGTVQRSISNVTVPGIDIQPPSRSPTNSSEGTVMDNVLLTPEHANTVLPEVYSSQSNHEQSATFTSNHSPDPIVINQLPPGFVPLSPIPSLKDFKPDDHEYHRTAEPFRGGGYQIYAGTALIPETRITYGQGMPSTSGSHSGSMLFGEVPRPSTAAGGFSNPKHANDARKRVSSFGASPAPLNRPFSIFSDE